MELRILGPLEVDAGDGPVSLGPPKQRALLALLLLRSNEVVPRETAIDTLWGERPPERAANALQVYVHGLRKLLGKESIALRGAGYALDVTPGELDLLRFERLLADGQATLAADDPATATERFGEALGLWRGEPLADLPPEMLADERARLAELRLRAHELNVDARLALGWHEDLVAEIETLVAAQPFRGRPRAQLMLALYRAGRQAEALAAFQAARRTMADELGLEPSADLRELERAILRQDPSLRLARRQADLRLPEPRTALVGRALDVVAVATRLRDADTRLLTLTGPGGVGKTRLAIEAAAELGSQLGDGAFFVDLAPLADPRQVVAAIAAALDIAEQETPTMEAVLATLGDRAAVVVLDNFERLLASADAVSKLLGGAPRVRALVTSRTPLGLAGEHEYAVAPLDVPAESEAFEALARNDSVSVFVARAQAADREFQLTGDNAADVAGICRAVDGLPLALELAAARAKLLTPAQILERLARPLEVLAGGGRDLPERHQTLRATIDWSHDLLDEQERRLFAELAVFSGGCTLEAAEAVCDARLDTLAALLDNGLVRRQQPRSGEPRFRLLDVVHEYAAERLEERGAHTVRDRHARYYTLLADRLGPELIGPQMPTAREQLTADHGNLRAALAHALTREPELGFRLIGALRPYWGATTRGSEASAWLESAFGDRPAAATPAQVGALVVLGRRYMNEGRYEESRAVLEQAVADGRRFACSSEAAVALTYLAWLAAAAGDYADSLRFADEAVDLARRGGDRWAERQGLAMVAGALINRGEVAAARPHLDRSLVLAEQLGDPATLVLALVNSGYGAICAGDLGRARSELERAVGMCKELDQAASTVGALQALAWQANLAGDRARAEAILREALELLREEGRHSYRVDVLTEVAVTLAEAAPEKAARILGAATAGAAAAGMRRSVPMTERVEALRELLAKRLGEDELEARLADGALFDLETATDDALAALDHPAATATT